MRGVMFILAAIAVIGLAFWAYRENYTTQAASRELRALHIEIGAAHDRLQMLRAEWAYLNRPDRLADLADLNFDRLGLLHLDGQAFGLVDQVIYPPLPPLTITNPVEVSGDLRDMSEEPL